MEEKESHQKDILQFRLKGRLDERWLKRFKGFTLQYRCKDESLLTGEIEDQDALYEVINKIRDIGIPLIAIERLDGGRRCCQ